jgi:hypothetical protein
MVKVELSFDEIEGLYINLIHYKEYVEDEPRDEFCQKLIEELNTMMGKLDSVLTENSE